MTSSKRLSVAVGVIIVLIYALFFEKIAGIDAAYASEEGKKASPPAQEIEKKASPYDLDLKPLTTAECGQCHISIFNNIKKQGARHQIDCVRCHIEYHVYNPRKQNYNEIMPKCEACHLSATKGPFHGKNEKLTPCLTCHIDPHKPVEIPMSTVEASCALCHTKEGGEINNYPSKHTSEVSCADCHSEKHGNIPECSVCHESHSPEVEMASADCMGCHPVHKPTKISYEKETISIICAGCHGKAYKLLQKETKHTAVKCSECHLVHKEIPSCTKCHGKPHPKMMMDTTKCGGCHGIAHDLLM